MSPSEIFALLHPLLFLCIHAADVKHNPCQNGGILTAEKKCQCPERFFGEFCERNAIEVSRTAANLLAEDNTGRCNEWLRK